MKKIIVLVLFLWSTQQAFCQGPVGSVPFELFGDHIFISLSVDDSEPVDFVFDTGDGLAVIDIDVAKRLGLNLNHGASKTSAQGRIKGSLIEHNKVELGGVKVEEIELYSTDLGHLEHTIGRNIDGIIGYDLLQNFVVKIDYDDMTFKLYDPNSFTYSGPGEGFSFKLDNYIPHITCTVKLNNGESLTDEFFINTGAGTTLDFNTVFANRHDIIGKTGDHYSYPVAGIGDVETLHYEGRVLSFGFGKVDFQNLPIGISQAKHGIQHNKKVAGIIGNGVLSKFNITLDYKRSMVYFEANKKFKEPFLVNASGIHLQQDKTGEKVLIHRVFEGSPAAAAGLLVDTEILAVNDKPVSEFKLPELRKLLRSVNDQVKLKVNQQGVEKEVTLDLTALI